MIDWITVFLPLDWDKPINDGKFVLVSRSGITEREVERRLSIRGAYDGSITARTFTRKGQKLLEISGNPIKFDQGHNLFGTNDLIRLVAEIAIHICRENKVKPSDANLKDWWEGNWVISRVDIAEMLSLSSRAEVRAVLRFLRDGAVVEHRGRGNWRDGTLYFGLAKKGSRASPWMLKFYCKGDELGLKEIPANADDFDSKGAPREWGGMLDEHIQNRELLCIYADNKLRIELTLRTKELKNLGLYEGKGWTLERPLELFREYLSRMQITKQLCEAVEEAETLSIGLRRTLTEWKRGGDLRATMNRQTLYRHRRQILDATGIDIATEPQVEPPTIPIRKLLIEDFQPEANPSWADRMITVLKLKGIIENERPQNATFPHG